MAQVNNNAFTSGFPVGGTIADFGLGNGSAAAPAPQLFGSKDSIVPISQNGLSAPIEPGYGAPNGASDGRLASFANIINGFIGALQNLLSSLGQQFGLTSGSSQSASPGQSYFTNARASSVGDPHDAFNGTSNSGGAVNQNWDNMQSHADLLDSDSFSGGYQVSTVATPSDKGVTCNASASISLDGGATNIKMNENGSYSVLSNGRNVSLEQGQSVSLGGGESVTLNADKSLTVSDQNGSGGSLTTTLASNAAGGVDVKSEANNIDLGGYLVTQNDTPSYPPPGPRRYVESQQQAPTSYGFAATIEPALQQQQIAIA